MPTPQVVVYHSSRPLSARLAAALHLGRLPRSSAPAGELAGVLAHLSGPAGLPALFRPFAGLRPEGWDAGGRRVFSAAPGVPPGVTGRALAGLAALAEVEPHTFLLAPVADPPWPLGALAAAGWRPAATGCARLAWPVAAAAVSAVTAHLAPAHAPGVAAAPATAPGDGALGTGP